MRVTVATFATVRYSRVFRGADYTAALDSKTPPVVNVELSVTFRERFISESSAFASDIGDSR